jgi:hypothetical protein
MLPLGTFRLFRFRGGRLIAPLLTATPTALTRARADTVPSAIAKWVRAPCASTTGPTVSGCVASSESRRLALTVAIIADAVGCQGPSDPPRGHGGTIGGRQRCAYCNACDHKSAGVYVGGALLAFRASRHRHPSLPTHVCDFIFQRPHQISRVIADDASSANEAKQIPPCRSIALPALLVLALARLDSSPWAFLAFRQTYHGRPHDCRRTS